MMFLSISYGAFSNPALSCRFLCIMAGRAMGGHMVLDFTPALSGLMMPTKSRPMRMTRLD
jgi:hypothetical protein